MSSLLVAALVFVSVTVWGLAVAPSRASAHDGGCVGVSWEPSVACVRSAHKIVDACDRHADGHWVWAEAYAIELTGSGGDKWVSVSDTNGSASGCGNLNVGWDYSVAQVRVCVQYEGCGPWLWIGPPH